MSATQIDFTEYGYFAGNEWRHAGDNHFFEVHEPYSGKLFARVAAGSRADARVAVDAASKAFSEWSETAPAEKARLFLRAAEIVRRRRSEIAEVLARETGSTISCDVSTGPCRGDAPAGRGLGVPPQRRGSGNKFARHATRRTRPARKSPRHLASWRVSRETRSRMSSSSRTATAPPGRSTQVAPHGFTAIPQDKRSRSNDG